MLNTHVNSTDCSQDLTKALRAVGVFVTHYNLEVWVAGTPEQEQAALDLLTTYDIAAGQAADVAAARALISVTPRQFRLALLRAGLLDAVGTAIKSAPADMQISWEFAMKIKRDFPGLDALAAAVGKTPADTDAIFALAATIK